VCRLVRLLPELTGVVTGAHDLSTGGLGVALARMAVASPCGASVEIDPRHPTAALYGERVGRAVVAVPRQRAAQLRELLAARDVGARRIGTAEGEALRLRCGEVRFVWPVDQLAEAWHTAF
jgi:phosphoribosylformylglycinamidine synthase